MSRLRVALMTTSVEFGGIERVLLSMIQHMAQDIELVPVVFTRAGAMESSFLDRIRALGASPVTIAVNASGIKYLNPARNIVEAMRLFGRHRFDVVHSHAYRADLIALAVASRFRLPLVSTCHGFISNDRRLSLYNRLDRFLLRYFTSIIAVSAPIKEDLVAHGVPAHNIEVIRNAVAAAPDRDRERARAGNRSQLGIPNEEFVFGYVGRLSEEKGLDTLLHAAARLRSAPRLLLVGDGPQREWLERTARELGIADRTHFAGFQRDTAGWYAAMDAFVLPSRTEGTPIALLEAMVHRLPIVASAVGGIPAVISHGQNGLLVPPETPGELADAMRMVADSEALGRTLAEAALQSIRRDYDVGEWIAQIRQLYRRVTGHPVAH